MKKQTNYKTVKSISLLFLIIGLGILLVNGVLMFNTYQFKTNAIKDVGLVTATPNGKYHPEVEYSTNDGKAIKYTQNGFHKGYTVDEKIEILYLPDDPYHPRVNSFMGIWGIHMMFLIMGLGFCIMGWIKFKNPQSKMIYTNIENN